MQPPHECLLQFRDFHFRVYYIRNFTFFCRVSSTSTRPWSYYFAVIFVFFSLHFLLHSFVQCVSVVIVVNCKLQRKKTSSENNPNRIETPAVTCTKFDSRYSGYIFSVYVTIIITWFLFYNFWFLLDMWNSCSCRSLKTITIKWTSEPSTAVVRVSIDCVFLFSVDVRFMRTK